MAWKERILIYILSSLRSQEDHGRDEEWNSAMSIRKTSGQYTMLRETTPSKPHRCPHFHPVMWPIQTQYRKPPNVRFESAVQSPQFISPARLQSLGPDPFKQVRFFREVSSKAALQ